jgi:hypothetical protein
MAINTAVSCLSDKKVLCNLQCLNTMP